MKTIKIDNKWSIKYDDQFNDKPKKWLRYGEFHSDFNENNAVVAMFYAILEAKV